MTSGTAILPFDDDHFALLADKARTQGLSILSFGSQDEADIQLLACSSQQTGQQLTIRHNHTARVFDVYCGLSAPHHATTAMIILACLDVLGLPWAQAMKAIGALREVDGRGNQQTITWQAKSSLLINDSYNAGPASMQAALAYVASLPHQNKALILTEMRELGTHCKAAHQALLPLIKAVEADVIILVGPALNAIATALSGATNCHHFQTAQEASEALTRLLEAPDLIFIKGSNGSGAPRLAADILYQSNAFVSGEARLVS